MKNNMLEKYPEVFNEHSWHIIEREVFEKVKSIVSLGIKTKLLSELISELTEKIAGQYFKKLYGDIVKCARNDNDPDLTIGTFPLEIKVAKCNTMGGQVSWRGGTFSKREGNFIFIVWDFDNDALQFFGNNTFKFSVYTCYLTKNDWSISKYDNYYATNYNLKLMLDNPTYKNIVGGIYNTKRNVPKPSLVSL